MNKFKNIDLNKKRMKILIFAKKIVPIYGWNKNTIIQISSASKIKKNEIIALFPTNYIDLIKFYMNDQENKMIKKVNKLNLNNMRTHEKINKII